MALHEDDPGGSTAHSFEPHAAQPRKKIQKPYSGHGQDVEKGFLDTIHRRLRIFAFGAISVLPFAFPAMIRMMKPGTRLQAAGHSTEVYQSDASLSF